MKININMEKMLFVENMSIVKLKIFLNKIGKIYVLNLQRAFILIKKQSNENGC